MKEPRIVTAADWGGRPVVLMPEDRGDIEPDYFDCETGDLAFWESPASLRKALGDRPWPERVYGTEERVLTLHAEEVIDGAIESQELHEEANDLIEAGGEAALQELLDTWCEKYASKVRTFFADESVIVREGGE